MIGKDEEAQKVNVEDTGLGEAVIEGAQWFAGILLLTLVMLYFMLCSRGLLLKKLLAITRRGRARRNAVRIVRHLQHEISVYLLTVTAINTVLGLTTAAVLGLAMGNRGHADGRAAGGRAQGHLRPHRGTAPAGPPARTLTRPAV